MAGAHHFYVLLQYRPRPLIASENRPFRLLVNEATRDIWPPTCAAPTPIQLKFAVSADVFSQHSDPRTAQAARDQLGHRPDQRVEPIRRSAR